MARNLLKFKDFSEKTQNIVSQIEEDSFNDMTKDPEVAIVDNDDNLNYEDLLEAGARLLSADRKNIFRGETTDGQILLIAGDKESEVREWLDGFVAEEEEDEETAA